MGVGTIKGITVEIGGNTGPLEKALQGVNKTSRDLQSELKQVDKLLKLDPANTELLAQRQKLLAENIENTKNKLNTLKEAEKQVQQQVTEGKVSEEQYRAFQREIVKTEQSVKSLGTQSYKLTDAFKIESAALEENNLKIVQAKEAEDKLKNSLEIADQKLELEKAELDKNTEALDKNAKKTDGLKIKRDSLNSQITTQKEKIAILNTQLDKLTNAEEKNEKAILEKQTELAKAEKELQSYQKELKQTEKSLDKFTVASENLNDFGSKAAATGQKTLPATLAIVGLGTAAAKAASDLNESSNKVDVAFKTSAESVKKWSDTTLEKFGIAKGSALDMAALFGDMGTAMGQTPKQAEKMSTSLVGLAGDLASFKNIGIQQAQDALKGIFTGEGESLKTLGIIMQDSTLKEYAHAEGIKKKYEQMTLSEKVQLRYNYVMEKTKNAQGDFERTSGGTANSTRVLTESIKQLGESFGQVLLPIITPIIQGLAKLITWLGTLDNGTKTVIVVIAVIIAAIGPLLMLIGSMATGLSAITALFVPLAAAITGTTTAQLGLNAAMMANPIGILIGLIVAIVAAIVILWNTNDDFRNAITLTWEAIKDMVKTAIDAIIKAFWMVIDFVKNNWQALLLMIVNPFAGAFKLLYDNCDAFKAFIDKFVKNIIDFFTKTIPDFIKKIIDWFKDLPAAMVETGKNIVKGIWEGIKNSIKWLKDKIAGFAGGIVDGIKETLGIHSPSQVLADQVGKFMAQGIGIGFEDEMKNVSLNIAKAIPTQSKQYASGTEFSTGQNNGNIQEIYNFNKESIVLDARSIPDIISVVNMAKSVTQTRRAGKVAIP